MYLNCGERYEFMIDHRRWEEKDVTKPLKCLRGRLPDFLIVMLLNTLKRKLSLSVISRLLADVFESTIVVPQIIYLFLRKSFLTLALSYSTDTSCGLLQLVWFPSLFL